MPQVLNIPVLHRVLQKAPRHTCLTGILWTLNMLGFEYTRVVNM